MSCGEELQVALGCPGNTLGVALALAGCLWWGLAQKMWLEGWDQTRGQGCREVAGSGALRGAGLGGGWRSLLTSLLTWLGVSLWHEWTVAPGSLGGLRVLVFLGLLHHSSFLLSQGGLQELGPRVRGKSSCAFIVYVLPPLTAEPAALGLAVVWGVCSAVRAAIWFPQRLPPPNLQPSFQISGCCHLLLPLHLSPLCGPSPLGAQPVPRSQSASLGCGCWSAAGSRGWGWGEEGHLDLTPT